MSAAWPPILQVVADDRPQVGAGHLGRSLALAEAWMAAGGQAHAAVDSASPWADRYAAAGVSVGVAPGADVVVADGYDLTDEVVDAAAPGAQRVVIDDHGLSQVTGADLVVDQNLGAEAPPGRALTGPRYALLRGDVVARRAQVVPDRATDPQVLLLAGGGEPPAEVVSAFEAVVAASGVGVAIEVRWLRGRTDVGAMLAEADVALSAAGSTVWELALLGVPAMVVSVADNQRPVARAVGTAGVAIDGGDLASLDVEAAGAQLRDLLVNPQRRTALGERSWALVDGLGGRRVATEARSLLVTLMPAAPDDARLLWEWANDAEVRANAFDPTPIAWDDHLRWFEDRLARAEVAIWMASDHHGELLGQVRIEVTDGVGEIDVSVSSERRGEGWAAPLLAAAAHAAPARLQAVGLRTLQGSVLVENERSGRAFVAADFDRGADGSRGGKRHQTYTRRCDG